MNTNLPFKRLAVLSLQQKSYERKEKRLCGVYLNPGGNAGCSEHRTHVHTQTLKAAAENYFNPNNTRRTAFKHSLARNKSPWVSDKSETCLGYYFWHKLKRIKSIRGGSVIGLSSLKKHCHAEKCEQTNQKGHNYFPHLPSKLQKPVNRL